MLTRRHFTRFKAPGVSNSQLSSSALFEQGVKRASDDESADLAGAGADFVQLCVAQEASCGVVIDVAVAPCGEGTRW